MDFEHNVLVVDANILRINIYMGKTLHDIQLETNGEVVLLVCIERAIFVEAHGVSVVSPLHGSRAILLGQNLIHLAVAVGVQCQNTFTLGVLSKIELMGEVDRSRVFDIAHKALIDIALGQIIISKRHGERVVLDRQGLLRREVNDIDRKANGTVRNVLVVNPHRSAS